MRDAVVFPPEVGAMLSDNSDKLVLVLRAPFVDLEYAGNFTDGTNRLLVLHVNL